MDMGEFVSSKFVKAEDLAGQVVRVTIAKVGIEEVGQAKDRKATLSFVGKDKGLVLNRTNTKALIDAFGKDSDAWVGQKIELYATETLFQGKPVQGLRVRPAPKKAAPKAPVVTAPEPAADDELNDDINF